MRRYARTLAVIAVLVIISGLTLGFQKVEIRGFQRTGDNPLGLKLGLDLQGGSHLVYEAALTDAAGERIEPTPDQMDSLRRIIERRVNQTGLGEPVIQTLGEDRLLVQLPGVDDPARAKAIIGETARLEFKHRQHDVPVPVDLDETSVLSVTIDELPVPPDLEESGDAADGADDVIVVDADDLVDVADGGEESIVVDAGDVDDPSEGGDGTVLEDAGDASDVGDDGITEDAGDASDVGDDGMMEDAGDASDRGDDGMLEDVGDESDVIGDGTMEDAGDASDVGDDGMMEDAGDASDAGDDGTMEDSGDASDVGDGGMTEDSGEASDVGDDGMMEDSGEASDVGDDAVPDDAGEEAAETGEDAEPEAAFLLVEFTDSGAETFGEVVDRLLESAVNFFSGGSAQPNRVQVDIAGDEFRTLTLQAGAVERVPETNTFAFALLNPTGQPLAPTIEESRSIFGESPAVSFVEVYGAFDEDIGLTGDDLARAYAGTHQTTNQPIVNIEFNAEGARLFGELTKLIINTNDRIAIFLDDEELIAPAVDQVITGGAAFIRGDFTPERAQDISQLLEAGRLPIPIELVQERDVDATLGADSLRKSVIAGLVGLAMVLVFMTAYYRVPGLVAAVALLIYGAIVLAVFKLIPVTLTLSGVAAAILSVGMAVDANILIFERMKDELRAGRTLLTSINIGFNRAWPAIRDGNVSTLITCAILFWFADTLGASVVQGFAATLAIGVLISMFSAIVVSRTLLRMLATTRMSDRPSWFAPVGKRFLPEGSR